MSLALVACGGNDDAEGGGSPSSANTLKGEPVVAMMSTSVDFPGASFEQGFETAKAYAQYINGKGGIKGRPLEIFTCDDKGTAANAEACAREAIKKKVIANVAYAGFYGPNIQAILSPAGISSFGMCCGFAETEFNDPLAFGFGPDPIMSNSSVLVTMMKDGCKNIGELFVVLPVSDAINNGSTEVLEAAGYTGDIKFVPFQGTDTDLSPAVAKLVSDNSDCIILFGNDQHWAKVLPPLFASGSKARLYGFKGNLSEKAAQGFEEQQQIKDGTVMSPYADISDPAYADYRQALKDYGAKDGLDYNSLTGLGAWTGFQGFTQIVEAIKGEVTAKSFAEQAKKTVIKSNGQLVSDIDLARPLTGGVAPYDKRVFNRSYFVQQFDGKKRDTIDMQDYVDKM